MLAYLEGLPAWLPFAQCVLLTTAEGPELARHRRRTSSLLDGRDCPALLWFGTRCLSFLLCRERLMGRDGGETLRSSRGTFGQELHGVPRGGQETRSPPPGS